jgi:hypothetical protein
MIAATPNQIIINIIMDPILTQLYADPKMHDLRIREMIQQL